MSNVSEHSPAHLDASAPPSLARLLWIWLGLGVQSFGGGAATLYLIRRAVVEQHHWVSDEEFARDWAICQLTPGINLLGLTILTGWRLARWSGAVIALTGLLLPSVSITILLTAIYASVRELTVVQAALHGVIPATVGLGLLLAFQMTQSPLQKSKHEGVGSVLLSCALLAGSSLAVGLWHLPVLAVLFGAAGLCAIFHWGWSGRLARRHL